MNKELLERIEKLERAVQDIWSACACLRKDLDEDIGMPEKELPEVEEPEHECEDGCPSCSGCYGIEEEEPERPEEPEEVDHD